MDRGGTFISVFLAEKAADNGANPAAFSWTLPLRTGTGRHRCNPEGAFARMLFPAMAGSVHEIPAEHVPCMIALPIHGIAPLRSRWGIRPHVLPVMAESVRGIPDEYATCMITFCDRGGIPANPEKLATRMIVFPCTGHRPSVPGRTSSRMLPLAAAGSVLGISEEQACCIVTFAGENRSQSFLLRRCGPRRPEGYGSS